MRLLRGTWIGIGPSPRPSRSRTLEAHQGLTCPRALMREADLDALIVEVLEAVHGPDPMVLVR